MLTGQYNRNRSGTNVYEPVLADSANITKYFTNTAYYQTDSTDYLDSTHTFNPIMAQPLWVSNVPIGIGTPNVLLAATLNSSVYAFNADTGRTLWADSGTTSLARKNCGAFGKPFVPDPSGHPGVTPLAYYGIVSTPVIDLAKTDPVVFVVTACTASGALGINWYINAIDIATGGDLISVGTPVAATNFSGPSQLQRPALLITHTVGVGGAITGTYLYVAFGTGAFELDSTYLYNGWVFGYTVNYSGTQPTSVSLTAITTPQFNTTPSNLTSNVFPSTSSASPGTLPLIGNSPACATGHTCYYGDNWVGVPGPSVARNGGIWMKGTGPSSDSNKNIYFTAGNGPFDCNDPNNNQTSCTAVTGTNKVLNLGQSVIELNSATASLPLTPADFFTPYSYHFLNDSTLTQQFKVLNRYDLDFGTPGPTLITTNGNAQTWAVTADKTGYIYVMPTLNSGTGSQGMGQFRSGDAGLTAGSYTTQASFQGSRRTAGTSGVCPSTPGSDGSHFTDTDCDQIMGLAWWNNNLFIWPENETVLGFKGTVGTGGVSYTFGTTPYDPCSGSLTCTNFPANYTGGWAAMGIAGNASASKGTLWATVADATTGNGGLWGYNIISSTLSLSNIFTPTISSTNAANCTGLPFNLPATWRMSAFAEPTTVNGKIYVPVSKAFTSTSSLITGGGILVYSACQ